MSSPLPHLLQQIKNAYGLTSDVERLVKKTRAEYASEDIRTLKRLIDAHDQYLVTHLLKARNIQIETIVIKDIIKVREALSKKR